jgi:hypothetical protein
MQLHKTKCEVHFILFWPSSWNSFLCVFKFTKFTENQNNCVSYLALTDCVRLVRTTDTTCNFLYIPSYHCYNNLIACIYPISYLAADQNVSIRTWKPGITKIMKMAVHSAVENWFFICFLPCISFVCSFLNQEDWSYVTVVYPSVFVYGLLKVGPEYKIGDFSILWN